MRQINQNGKESLVCKRSIELFKNDKTPPIKVHQTLDDFNENIIDKLNSFNKNSTL